MGESRSQDIWSEPGAPQEAVDLTEQVQKMEIELKEEREKNRELSERNAALETRHEKNLKRIEALKKSNKESRKQATLDPLTGLFNRRGGALQIQRILKKYRRSLKRSREGVSEERRGVHEQVEYPKMCVLTLDIDHFKPINDTYGHEAGDTVLQEMARRLMLDFRADDFGIRTGGEELAVVLLGTEAKIGYEILYKKFDNDEREFKPDENPRIGFDIKVEAKNGEMVSLRVTFSGGIADITQDQPFKKALKIADGLLYQAKQAGRNQILISEPGDTTEAPSN